MVGKTKAPTKAQERRFMELQAIGCICCRRTRGAWRPAEIHHLVEGHKRLGHDATIPLCEWHHRGIASTLDKDGMENLLGPSLALNKRAFIEAYGTERKLLETVDAILERRVR